MKAERNHARLYRSSDDVVIAGVCAGVADYLGLPSGKVRLGDAAPGAGRRFGRFGSISCCGSSCPKVPNGSKGIPGRLSPARDCPGRGLRISDMRTGPGY